MTKLRTDWAAKMHMAIGYQVVEACDDEALRAFNAAIRGIIQSERQKHGGWKK